MLISPWKAYFISVTFFFFFISSIYILFWCYIFHLSTEIPELFMHIVHFFFLLEPLTYHILHSLIPSNLDYIWVWFCWFCFVFCQSVTFPCFFVCCIFYLNVGHLMYNSKDKLILCVFGNVHLFWLGFGERGNIKLISSGVDLGMLLLLLWPLACCRC